jgi:hypothetical protein
LSHSRELNDVFGEGNMNFDKFKDEHCCNEFCSYYGLQPFSPETGLTGRDTPTSEGNSLLKNPIEFDQATKGKGRAEPEVDDDYVSPSWERGVADDFKFSNFEQKWTRKDAASTSTEGGYTKGMVFSL